MAITFGTLDFHTAFQPSSAFPLDAREYFESYSDALAAAKSATEAGGADSNFYYGQVLRVVENNIASLYQIQPNNTLSPVGAGGSLDAINDRVTAVEEDIVELEENYRLLEVLTGNLKTKTEELESTFDGIDDKIASAVAAANHLEFTIVDDKDSIDTAADNAGKFIYLVAKGDDTSDAYDEYMVINGKVELIGHTKVDLTEYAKTSEIEDSYVKKETGKRLLTDEEGSKIAAMLEITGLSEELMLTEDGILGIQSVAMEKITSLIEEMGNKVDKESGSRLLTELEAEKLAKLVLNEDGSVGLSGKVNAENVQGLADLLAKKVDKAEGSRLMLDTEGEKLESIENGAQVNKIEKILLNNTELGIVDKAVNIPVAGSMLGLVKSTTVENGVAVDDEGVMTVNSINVNKLVQTEGEELVLNGGNAQD